MRVLVGVFDVGAYCGSMSSNYNLRARPLEVLVRSDGKLVVLAEKEDITKVFERENGFFSVK